LKSLKIKRETLEFILGAAKSVYPREFAGLLRKRKELIEEVLILPGTLSSNDSAVLRLHMLPMDPSVCGSVHSHPSSSFAPSASDIQFFGKFGSIHIIVAYPYDQKSWAAYNHRGERIPLEVVP